MEEPAFRFSEDMRGIVEQQRLGFVATVCPDGTPNLSPKGTTRIWDDRHLVFADIRSPKTVTNIRSNPWAEVNVVDPFARRGYRFTRNRRVAAHFAAKPWYRPVTTDAGRVQRALSRTERHNVDLIRKHEVEHTAAAAAAHEE